jgi:hypothetical protein
MPSCSGSGTGHQRGQRGAGRSAGHGKVTFCDCGSLLFVLSDCEASWCTVPSEAAGRSGTGVFRSSRRPPNLARNYRASRRPFFLRLTKFQFRYGLPVARLQSSRPTDHQELPAPAAKAGHRAWDHVIRPGSSTPHHSTQVRNIKVICLTPETITHRVHPGADRLLDSGKPPTVTTTAPRKHCVRILVPLRPPRLFRSLKAL